jgi:hypothetical protein
MNPQDPESAHRIVADYAALHEQHVTSGRLPAPVRTLAYPKQTIQEAVLTCVRTLDRSGQLTHEMLDWLEEAYAGLAEYLDEELVRVVTEYRDAAEALGAEGLAARDKVHTPAWGRLTETGRLAGNVARAISEDAARLRVEFREQLPAIQSEAT